MDDSQIAFQSIEFLKLDSLAVLKSLKESKILIQKIGDPNIDKFRTDVGAVSGIYAIFKNDVIV